MSWSRVSFASWSTISFPSMPQWLGTQQKRTASQLSGHCEVISNRLWRNLQNENRVRHGDDLYRSSFLSSFMDCSVRNKIMYVLSWQTDSVLTRLLLWCLFPSLLRHSGHKHQNNHLGCAETVRHSCTLFSMLLEMLLRTSNLDILTSSSRKW